VDCHITKDTNVLRLAVDRKKQPYYNSTRTAPAALLGHHYVMRQADWQNYPQLPRMSAFVRIDLENPTIEEWTRSFW
jgi:hypothetical protein